MSGDVLSVQHCSAVERTKLRRRLMLTDELLEAFSTENAWQLEACWIH